MINHVKKITILTIFLLFSFLFLPQKAIANKDLEYQGRYSFSHTDINGVPAKWNWCSPIYFKTNTMYSDKMLSDSVVYAFSELSKVTGKEFINDGHIDDPHIYKTDNNVFLLNTIVIVFSNPKISSEIKKFPAIEQTFIFHEKNEIAYSKIIINYEYVKKYPKQLKGIIMHELGHSMNLAHVKDPKEIMFSFSLDREGPAFGLGDIQGFSQSFNKNC